MTGGLNTPMQPLNDENEVSQPSMIKFEGQQVLDVKTRGGESPDKADEVGYHVEVDECTGGDGGEAYFPMNDQERILDEIEMVKHQINLLKDAQMEKTRELYQIQNDREAHEVMSQKIKLSNALKMISKLKNFSIKQKAKDMELHENQREAISLLENVSAHQKKRKNNGQFLAPLKAYNK